MDKILTIAIPTYNRENLLKRAIESIIPQMNEKVELLISDNASTDGTEQLVKKYEGINYIRNVSNIGPDANFLQCYTQSSGKYILLLGSDDILLPDAIDSMLYALKDKEYSLVFINHGSFENNNTQNLKYYIEPSQKVLSTSSKKEFMEIAAYQLTYMSSFIMSKKLFERIDKPEKYNSTNFIHCCCAFESTKANEQQFGIIFSPCVGQDVTPNNAVISNKPGNIFFYFGECMKKTYCEIAPQFGYSAKQMNHIFMQRVFSFWPKMIISFKAQYNRDDWERDFWKYGYKNIKEYPQTWIKIMPILIVPDSLIRILYTWYKKHKG